MSSILLLCFLNSVAFGAEPITYDGKEGIFIESQKAKELLSSVEEKESLKKEKVLLLKKIEVLDLRVKNSKGILKIEENKSEILRKRIEFLIKKLEEKESKEERFLYVGVGLISLGVIIGMGTVFLSSEVLLNIR